MAGVGFVCQRLAESFAILHTSQGCHHSFDCCTCQAQMATDGQEKEKEMLSGVFKCLIREIWQCPLADLDTVPLKSHPLR